MLATVVSYLATLQENNNSVDSGGLTTSRQYETLAGINY